MAALACGAVASLSFGDSPTFRNNVQRTGVFDDRPGPAKPKVLWSFKQPEHFVAAPVPDLAGGKGGSLFVTGLGAFNTAMLHSLTLELRPETRERWSKASPFIKMPSVSSPAVAGDLLVFGDGMHQTDGATLYCVSASKGVPLWKYDAPGKLVHMECPPTISKERVFIGGGDAGVVAVMLNRVMIKGAERGLAEVKGDLEKQYTELFTRYEEARKKDPLAPLPDEGSLPQVTPKLLWQKGKSQWHVDAPVMVTADGSQVLAASAYIDDDKVGKRVIMCLNAADGAPVWETPLTLNPWGGPTIAGDTVLVACSSIRYDVGQIGDAKGQIVALDLATGKVKWTKDVAGGVLAPTVVSGDVFVYGATDGKIYCRAVADAGRRWVFEAKNPIFGAPAVAGDLAYAVDLKGVLYAINLADGTLKWSLDVPNDPAVQAPGIVFASPAVFGGHIYVVTNNLNGEHEGKPAAVVCVGEESEATPPRQGPAFTWDAKKRTLTIPCEVAPRKLPTLKDIYPLEVVATYPTPQGQKAHETVVVFDTGLKLSDVHKKLEELGAKAGHGARNDGTPPSGSRLNLWLEIPGPTGKVRTIPMEKAIVDARTNKPLPGLEWYFTGSASRQLDPDKPEKTYGADISGTLIAIYPVTDETLVQSNLTLLDSSVLKLELNRNLVPEEGTPVQLVIEVKP